MKWLKVIGTILFIVVTINLIFWFGLKVKVNPSNEHEQNIDSVIEIEN
ncbi:hypothetical protein [Lysinibacillus sp. 38-6]